MARVIAVITMVLDVSQSCKFPSDVSNPTSSKPVDGDDDDDDDEPAEDMDAYEESGRLEDEDNVIISLLLLLM